MRSKWKYSITIGMIIVYSTKYFSIKTHDGESRGQEAAIIPKIKKYATAKSYFQGKPLIDSQML